jgi:DNA-binding HxlR family transcriptional regulator
VSLKKISRPPASQKMLTQQLRELEVDGIVLRKAYAEVPPRVEYCLSDKGVTLTPILNNLYAWGEQNSDSSRHAAQVDSVF